MILDLKKFKNFTCIVLMVCSVLITSSCGSTSVKPLPEDESKNNNLATDLVTAPVTEQVTMQTNEPIMIRPNTDIPISTMSPSTSNPVTTVNPDPDHDSNYGELGKVTLIRGNQVKFSANSKNILLLGMSEENLCDSIIILSVDESTKNLNIVSIPRNAYVPYSTNIVNAMKKSGYYYSPGSCCINSTMYVGSEIVRYTGGKFGHSGIDFLCAVLDNLFAYGCEIDEYMIVDFDGFMGIIDIVGGVYVTSEDDMYKTYPDGSKEIWITRGRQKLDAEKALFYVRNRTRFTSTGENAYSGGDEYRKTNQVKFIAEVMPQIFTTENLRLSYITDILNVLKDNVKHSLGDNLGEYVDIGLDYANGGYKIGMYVVTGDEIDPFGDAVYYIKIY